VAMPAKPAPTMAYDCGPAWPVDDEQRHLRHEADLLLQRDNLMGCNRPLDMLRPPVLPNSRNRAVIFDRRNSRQEAQLARSCHALQGKIYCGHEPRASYSW
jgi:hypothetical protein